MPWIQQSCLYLATKVSSHLIYNTYCECYVLESILCSYYCIHLATLQSGGERTPTHKYHHCIAQTVLGNAQTGLNLCHPKLWALHVTPSALHVTPSALHVPPSALHVPLFCIFHYYYWNSIFLSSHMYVCTEHAYMCVCLCVCACTHYITRYWTIPNVWWLLLKHLG